jgi:hypothetical protein
MKKCHKSAKVALQNIVNLSTDISCNEYTNVIENIDETEKVGKKVGKHICDICKYITSKKYNYIKHLSSVKNTNLVAHYNFYIFQ